jgi:hypothetical protein
MVYYTISEITKQASSPGILCPTRLKGTNYVTTAAIVVHCRSTHDCIPQRNYCSVLVSLCNDGILGGFYLKVSDCYSNKGVDRTGRALSSVFSTKKNFLSKSHGFWVASLQGEQCLCDFCLLVLIFSLYGLLSLIPNYIGSQTRKHSAKTSAHQLQFHQHRSSFLGCRGHCLPRNTWYNLRTKVTSLITFLY